MNNHTISNSETKIGLEIGQETTETIVEPIWLAVDAVKEINFRMVSEFGGTIGIRD